MIRFLFRQRRINVLLATLSISSWASAATLHSFGDEHFYPVVERAHSVKSQNILLAGLVLTAASYNKQYEISKATEEQIKNGEAIGNGAFSLGIVGLQMIFDSDSFNYQSHLRGLVYDAAFVFGLKAVMSGQWPGANMEYKPFPSTHTSIAFMSATSLTYAYGWPMAILAYPAAAFVGYSKLGNESERLSDVIAGATIGIWLGRASSYENAATAKDVHLQKESQLSALEVIPILTSNHIGTVIHYSF